MLKVSSPTHEFANPSFIYSIILFHAGYPQGRPSLLRPFMLLLGPGWFVSPCRLPRSARCTRLPINTSTTVMLLPST